MRRQVIMCPYKKAITHCHFSVKGAITYLIVQVKVNIPGKPEIKCRMLLDTGCGRAYIVQSRLSSTGGLRVPLWSSLLPPPPPPACSETFVFSKILFLSKKKERISITIDFSPPPKKFLEEIPSPSLPQQMARKILHKVHGHTVRSFVPSIT